MKKLKPILIISILFLAIGGVIPRISSVRAGQTDITISSDLGDAPDSSNSQSVTFEAYSGVPGNFPTVYGAAAAPYGPKHHNASPAFFLGTAISGEEEADTGFDSDADGINNLSLVNALANRDGADDGLQLPDQFEHCQMVSLQYTVTISEPVSAPLYFNLWLDWDNSGQWGDASALNCATSSVAEWGVQNQVLTPNSTGTFSFTTPTFMAWNPDTNQEMWLRATLSEQTASANDGSGTAVGYQYGETEDYFFQTQYRVFLPIVQGGSGGEDPEPTDMGTGPEFTDEGDVVATWIDLPEDGETAVIDATALQFSLHNRVNATQEDVAIHIEIFANGTSFSDTIMAGPLAPSQTQTVTVSIPALGLDSSMLRAPASLEGTVEATDSNGVLFRTALRRISFHGHEGNPSQIVFYEDNALMTQLSTMTLAHNATLSDELAQMIPPDMNSENMGEFVVFTDGDPVLEERSIDPDANEFVPPTEPYTDTLPTNAYSPQNAPAATYNICLKMWANPADDGFGEDIGSAGNWRARGAHVIVYQNNIKQANVWLNKYGCMVLNSNQSFGRITISYQGEHRLRNGGKRFYINHMPSWSQNNTDNHAKATLIINSPVSGKTYYPRLQGRDAIAILAYAIQERIFDTGLHKKELWVKFIGCGDVVGGGSCSSHRNGKRILYFDPTKLATRRKFVIAHEYGHALLALAAKGVSQDCSYGPGSSSFHGLKSKEYSSCAAGEGWAHFIAVAAWNDRNESNNPGATFVYWSKGGVVNVETGKDNAFCGQDWTTKCDSYGYEIDWMRHFWDFYSNNRASDAGNRPSIQTMVNIMDNAKWNKGGKYTSKRIEKKLSGAMLTRWKGLACANSIRECK